MYWYLDGGFKITTIRNYEPLILGFSLWIIVNMYRYRKCNIFKFNTYRKTMFTGIHVFIQDHQYMYTCRSKFLFESLFYHISNIQNNKYIWAFFCIQNLTL